MSVTQASRRDRSVSNAVSHTTPTRPDPTRPLSSGEPFHHNVAVGDARGSDNGLVTALTRRMSA